MDFEDLASRIGIDEEDFMELAGLFITTTRSDMDKIQQAMAEENPSDAAAAAHSIKGAAGNLGFEELAELAGIIESRGKEGSLEGIGDHMAQMEQRLSDVETQVAGG